MKKKVPDGQLDFFDLLNSQSEPSNEESAAADKAPEPAGEEPVKEAPDKEEPVRETPEAKQKTVTKQKKTKEGKALFKECASCWCRDCKHNSRNEAVPRDMCGKSMACPACDSCVAEGSASVCIIGSAGEGCKTRATEEGIYVPLDE